MTRCFRSITRVLDALYDWHRKRVELSWVRLTDNHVPWHRVDAALKIAVSARGPVFTAWVEASLEPGHCLFHWRTEIFSWSNQIEERLALKTLLIPVDIAKAVTEQWMNVIETSEGVRKSKFLSCAIMVWTSELNHYPLWAGDFKNYGGPAAPGSDCALLIEAMRKSVDQVLNAGYPEMRQGSKRW